MQLKNHICGGKWFDTNRSAYKNTLSLLLSAVAE